MTRTKLHIKENATPGSPAVPGFGTALPEDFSGGTGTPSKTQPGEFDWTCSVLVKDADGVPAQLPGGETHMAVSFTSGRTILGAHLEAATDTYMRTTLKMLDGDPIIAAVID